MSMVYEEERRRMAEAQAAAQNAQMAESMRQQQAAADRDREMFERSQVQQEQARRSKDSDTALALGQKKYDVLSGLLGKMGGSSGFGMQMATPGFSWSAGTMNSSRRPQRRMGPPMGGGGYEKQ